MQDDSSNTNWNAIQRATESDEILHGLVVRYMEHIQRHTRFQWNNLSGDDLDDFVQSFLLRLLRGEVFSTADQQRGRFRTYFVRCFDNHVRDCLRPKARDEAQLEHWDEAVEDSSQIWAIELFRAACASLQKDCLESDAEETWMIAEDRFTRPILEAVEPLSYEALRLKYKLDNVSVVAGRVRTAKRALEAAIRRTISTYVFDADEVEGEIEHLTAALPRQLADSASQLTTADFLHSDWYEDLAEHLVDSELSISLLGTADAKYKSYLDLLTNPTVPLVLLKQVRRMAKVWLKRGDPSVPVLAQRAIYYVTAANSISAYHERISGLTNDQLLRALRKLGTEPGLPVPLTEHIAAQIRRFDNDPEADI